MMISIFFLLLMFAGGIGVVSLVVFAIAKNRPWVAALAVGLVFMGLIVSGLLAALFFGYQRLDVPATATVPPQVAEQIRIANEAATEGIQNFNQQHGFNEVAVNFSGVKLSGVLTCIILIGVLIAIVFRRVISPAGGHGLRRAWPVVAVVVVVMWIAARTQYAVSYQRASAAVEASRQAALEVSARQQILSEHPGAVIVSQSSGPQQIAQADIHEQMDKFDAPRIPLSPEGKSPNVPAAPAPTAVPPAAAPPVAAADATAEAEAAADESPEKPKKDEKPKSASNANQKHKKSNKTPASGDTKQPQFVAQAKSSAAPGAPKDKPLAEKNLISVASAVSLESSGSRPAWTNESAKRTGNVRREVIETEEYQTADECYQAADVYLLLKTYRYIQQIAGRPYPEFDLPSITFRQGMILADGKFISMKGAKSSWSDPRLQYLNSLGITAEYARSELVAKDANGETREYVDTTDHPGMGPMKKLYLQIEFTPEIENVFRLRLKSDERQQRFAIAGVLAGNILVLLGFVFALLKIDTWTKGYYTKRLFLGVPAIIIAGVLLVAMLVTHATYR